MKKIIFILISTIITSSLYSQQFEVYLLEQCVDYLGKPFNDPTFHKINIGNDVHYLKYYYFDIAGAYIITKDNIVTLCSFDNKYKEKKEADNSYVYLIEYLLKMNWMTCTINGIKNTYINNEGNILIIPESLKNYGNSKDQYPYYIEVYLALSESHIPKGWYK